METTPTNFNLALTKGEYAEGIVRLLFEDRGYVVYQPTTSGAHAFDMMAIKDKKRCLALDVKAKARRNAYPDTGINEQHYQTYINFSRNHNMDFWVVFVDEMDGHIYGNEINSLNYPTPRIENSIRYFPLSNMKTLAALSDGEKDKLKSLNQRRHNYKPIKL